jgi:hypothetical protein
MNAALAELGPVARRRRPLAATCAALTRRSLTVGFLGGSITDARTGTRWPEPLVGWLVDAYPTVRVTVENAAIGATGSDLAVFRAQREIIARGCDLVFVEYAVNDFNQPTPRRQRTREGLLRQLLAAPDDVVLVHAFQAEMLPEMRGGIVPPSVAEFERLAEHYSLNSVWMGLHSLREVHRGLMTWEEWLPDGLHPENRGSLSYAQSVIEFLTAELAADKNVAPAPVGLPAPLDAGAWERTGFVPFEGIERTGPWMVRRWVAHAWIDQVLQTTAPGAGLRFSFEGRGLVLGFDFGRASSEVRYRVDGGEWQETHRERPAWVGDNGWYRPTVVADDLASGRHTFELETLPCLAGGGRGATTTIAFFGVIH